ncbi:hypothetical protein [Campylobacter vulpis]|nr:hypothetical protein [Campylobacter vulpis]
MSQEFIMGILWGILMVLMVFGLSLWVEIIWDFVKNLFKKGRK